MKKNLSLAGFGLAAMGLFMGSCVSKRKYMEAQTSAAERYRTDSTDWATRSNTMQQNISTLEQQNTTYQKSIDSLRTSSMTYQKRWDNFQSTYTQANTSTEQLHQEIHNAIDQYVEPSNVESRNGKIYVNLPEKMLFNAGSSTLSTKGKQALDKLAAVLASNENVDVDIIATAAYYNDGNTTTAINAATSHETTVSPTNPAGVTGDVPATDKDKTAAANDAANSATSSTEVKANVGDSSFPGSGSVTARTKQQDPNKKNSTAKSATAKKTTTTASTRKTNQGDKSMSFKSSPKSSKTKATASTAPSWNLNVARSTSIVRQLTQNGLPHARIVLAGQSGKGMTTNEWASTNRGYQIVVSPKMDYYQMMQQGQESTSMR
jgi:outer membrane protein OmpA-like peptidoglycan-associated protein